MLDIPAELRPPAPAARAQALGPIALLRVLARNPLEAWTEAHFEQPVVASGLSIGRVVVVNDPAAIRRVLLENCDNYEKGWLQRRVLSAGFTGGLLTVEDHSWRMQRRALAPLFARKTVLGFSSAMIEAGEHLVLRLAQQERPIAFTRPLQLSAGRPRVPMCWRARGSGAAPQSLLRHMFCIVTAPCGKGLTVLTRHAFSASSETRSTALPIFSSALDLEFASARHSRSRKHLLGGHDCS